MSKGHKASQCDTYYAQENGALP